MRQLIGPQFARDTAGLWLAFFTCLGGIYLVFGWLPTLLSSQGLDLAAASSGLATYNLGGVAGVLTWVLLTSFFGSRRPMLAGALGAAASASAMLLIPAHSPALQMAGLGLHGLLANAVQTSMYALAAHIYPTRVRASGVACAATIGRIGGIFSSLYGAAIISAGAATYWGAMTAAMVCAFVGLAIVKHHIPASGSNQHE
jgi:AAHS family 4-hydroxybenzoate transporter-like MFS transporter